MRALFSLVALAAVLLPHGGGAQPNTASPSRGKLLYETHCIECHSTQMHWRNARKSHDWPSLLTQVRGWQERAKVQWSEEDIDAVARYLNDTIYRYELPRTRDIAGRLPGSGEKPT